MKNRAAITPREEAAFIHGGSAGIDSSPSNSNNSKTVNKVKPVSISFLEANLNDIDNIIREEMISGGVRANRSDVIRAAVAAFKNLSKTEISVLIKDARLK